MTIALELLDAEGLRWAQRRVTEQHYLHKPVDSRCSPMAYGIRSGGLTIGCLIFGRPEATRKYGFYGSLDDVAAGRAEVSRWCILNLARVFIQPLFQGAWADKARDRLPGFVDRKGVWHSTLASTAVDMALERVRLDYLLAHPPCFPDEPFELTYCLSYCDTSRHKGTLYGAAGFELYCQNEYGIQTWRKPLCSLSENQRKLVLDASTLSARSRRYRAMRWVAGWEQGQLALA